MLYHFLYPLRDYCSIFNIFKYITFRAVVAFLLSTLISIIWGKYFIKFMKKKQFGQIIRKDGPKSHLKKQGTPTMGGLFIIGTILLTMLIVGNFSSLPLLVSLLVMVLYCILGFIDDYKKIKKKNSKGATAKTKILFQAVTIFLSFYILKRYGAITTDLYLPFVKGPFINLGMFFVFFMCLVVIGSSNAVNLTDGLDGLAMGTIITSTISIGIIAYVTGHKEISAYLFLPYIENVGELAVFCAAILGAGVGFLWYNSYPAQIFMGDVGSLSLGGALGIMAVLVKSEILFVVIGGIFVLETLSVILQVLSFKIRKKRVFKMAPIHHHFELLGWPEPKIIVRFWIVSIFFAIFSNCNFKNEIRGYK